MSGADDVAALSYEAALLELDAIITRLEQGDVELEAAVAAYQRGAALTRHCAQLLDRTEQTVTQLVVSAAGDQESPLHIVPDRVDSGARNEPRAGGGGAPPRARSVEEKLFGAAKPSVVAPPAGDADVDPDDIPF